MVPIVDGNSEHVAHAWRQIGQFWEKKSDLMTDLDLSKCLKTDQIADVLLTCAHFSELLSNIITMVYTTNA